MIAVGDLAREAAPAVLLLVELADEGPGVGRAGDDPDLWRAAEILELLHRHLASGWFGVQGQIVRHFRVRLAARWPSPRPSPRSSLPNYTLTDDPPREGDPLSDASARVARHPSAAITASSARPTRASARGSSVATASRGVW